MPITSNSIMSPSACVRASPRDNHLLAALSRADYERWLPDLQLVALPLGWVVYESGTVPAYGYFPVSGIVSKLFVMRDGASGEISVVGNEGMIGTSLFMGGTTTLSRAVVHSAGFAYRIPARMLCEEFAHDKPVQRVLLRFTQALITQTAQVAVCNRCHSIDQQLCRWLLMSLDRLPTNVLRMTQESIANMLGVRRESVTQAAGELQAEGLIHYRRGTITVPDRAQLEARVCECYRVVKCEYDRLLEPNRADQRELANRDSHIRVRATH